MIRIDDLFTGKEASQVLSNRLAIPAGQLADPLDAHPLSLRFF
jgi:hypothetical protein